MYFTSASIENFRNLKKLETTFSPDLNVVEGENAQGKTNFLEALYLLSTGQSFRSRDYRETIAHQKDWARLEAVLSSDDLISHLKVLLNLEEKELSLDDKRYKRWSPLNQKLRVLVFTPDSVSLFRASPGTRRRYLDLAIRHHFLDYSKALNQYEKVLKQRRELLEARAPLSLREPFEEQWAQLAYEILNRRQSYLADLLPYWEERLAESLKTKIKLSTFIDSELLKKGVQSPQDCLEILKEYKNMEESRGRILLGPHLDDWQVSFNGELVKKVASQGQQRILVIALKLAEADLFWQSQKKSPVFLLDDVGSELDSEHLERLLKSLSQRRSQIFLSSAQVGAFKGVASRVFRMRAGEVLPA